MSRGMLAAQLLVKAAESFQQAAGLVQDDHGDDDGAIITWGEAKAPGKRCLPLPAQPTTPAHPPQSRRLSPSRGRDRRRQSKHDGSRGQEREHRHEGKRDGAGPALEASHSPRPQRSAGRPLLKSPPPSSPEGVHPAEAARPADRRPTTVNPDGRLEGPKQPAAQGHSTASPSSPTEMPPPMERPSPTLSRGADEVEVPAGQGRAAVSPGGGRREQGPVQTTTPAHPPQCRRLSPSRGIDRRRQRSRGQEREHRHEGKRDDSRGQEREHRREGRGRSRCHGRRRHGSRSCRLQSRKSRKSLSRERRGGAPASRSRGHGDGGNNATGHRQEPQQRPQRAEPPPQRAVPPPPAPTPEEGATHEFNWWPIYLEEYPHEQWEFRKQASEVLEAAEATLGRGDGAGRGEDGRRGEEEP